MMKYPTRFREALEDKGQKEPGGTDNKRVFI